MFGTKSLTAEDRKRIKASILLQCAWRCYLARRAAQDAYRARYRKQYDTQARQHVYQHKQTLDVDEELPDYFSNVQIPDPMVHVAPPDYDPGPISTGQGYALLISNSLFPLGKWAPSHVELDADYDVLKSVLTHEHIGRIRTENCFSLKNPTTMDVKDILSRLHRIIRCDGFLFIYLATHVIHLVGAKDPGNGTETTYLAFRNSIWGKTKEIAESCIGILEFTAALNRIKCKHKTIALNYAHAPPPRRAMFASSKQVSHPITTTACVAYPTENGPLTSHGSCVRGPACVRASGS